MARITKKEYLNFLETVNVEEFTVFFKQNSNKRVCEKYGLKMKMIYRALNDLNITLTDQEKKIRNRIASEQTVIEKYGVSNVFQSSEFQGYMRSQVKEKYGVDNISKLPETIEKIKQTKIAKYGTIISEDMKKKSEQTCLERYGVSNYMFTEEGREKIKQTNLDRYGVTSTAKLPEFQERYKETMKAKYGENWGKIKLDKASETMMQRYGVPYYCMTPDCKEASNSRNNSKPNQNFKAQLENYKLPIETEFSLDKYTYDFKVARFLIEINPHATHNSSWSPYENGKPKDKYYHQAKTLTALKYGYFCIHVWDWSDVQEILCFIENFYLEDLSSTLNLLKSTVSEPNKITYNFKLGKIVKEELYDVNSCVFIYDDGLDIIQIFKDLFLT